MNKEIFWSVLAFVLSSLLVFFVLVFLPRNYLGAVKASGGVINVEKLFLAKPSYLYVVRKEYYPAGVVGDVEVGISRLFEPGVYRNVSLGEIYLPDFETFGSLHVYIYEENGDMLFDAKKDRLIGSGVRVLK